MATASSMLVRQRCRLSSSSAWSPRTTHGGVVVAVADGAHRAEQAQAPDILGEGPGRELAPVVGVDDRRGRRRPRCAGLGQSVVDQGRLTAPVDRPADRLARVEVQYDTAV